MSRLLQNVPAAFLVCGGPSINQLDLSQLNRRGVWTLAVNNVAGHDKFKPSAFVCSDPPDKFHNGIWRDPGIMKFVPLPKLRRGRSVLKQKLAPGWFEKLQMCASDCPNVWGFERRGWLLPDQTFFDEGASWGNNDKGVTRTGQPKTSCTMLLGIRILYELGIRCIYLLGADFDMGQKYSFAQARDADAIQSNNEQFCVVNDWLCEMTKNGVWNSAGLRIVNCSKDSKLLAFESEEFDRALIHTLDSFPPEPFDLSQWYEKLEGRPT